jgi:hypothetical protein
MIARKSVKKRRLCQKVVYLNYTNLCQEGRALVRMTDPRAKVPKVIDPIENIERLWVKKGSSLISMV